MKTNLILGLLLLGFNAYAQFDYFRWNKVPHNLSNASLSSKSGIACDIFNRVYYVDNYSKKIAWNYGVILQSSTIARSNSNIEY